MNIHPYQYLPLENARTIRLIALSPAKTADQPLECIILHAPLDAPPPYASLSYEWKGEKPQRPMACDDGSTILITPNCYTALVRLRLKKKFQILWVDAICINQADVQERNSQVSIMIDIYKSSERTFVWLGEGDSDSDLALQFSRRVSFIYRHKRLHRLLPRNSILSWNMLGTGCTPEALFSLASRSYWSRMWTIQEFTASVPIIFCGAAKPASGLGTLEAIAEVSQAQPYENSWPQFKGSLHRRWVGFNETIEGIPLLSSQYVHLSRMSSSDERDKVFALKGLFRNALKDLVIDYSKPAWDVYTEATRITITNEKSLAILQYVAHPAGDVRFPSWAVDWNYKQSHALPHYESSKSSHPDFRFSVDSRRLHLSGKIVGEVSRDVSSLFPYFEVTSMEFIFQDSKINFRSRNWICLRNLYTFYSNITNSIYPDFRTYFQAVVKFLDPDNKYNIATEGIITLVCQGDEHAAHSAIGDETPFLNKLNGTVLFITSEGQFGVSRRDGIRHGDKIALISGSDKPFIMRQVEGRYILISTSVISGLMEGELWLDDQSALEEFEII